MKLPHALVQAATEAVLPGCFYRHGEQEMANIDIDKTTANDRIVYLDDKMPFRFITNKDDGLTGTTYSCLLLLVPAKLTDTAEVRQPRVAEMVDAAARLMAELAKHPDVAGVKMSRQNDVLFNQFDRIADWVGLYLDLTPRGELKPAEQS